MLKAAIALSGNGVARDLRAGSITVFLRRRKDANLKDRSDAALFGFHELVVDKNARIVVTSVEYAKHAESQTLITYWDACAARGGLRLGRDLPASAVARLMSRLIVFEPVEQPRDFRIRLAGTGLIRRFGKDVSGCLLSEIYGEKQFESYANNLRKTLATKMPLVVDVDITEGPNQLFHIEYVFLPVLSYDGNAQWVVTGVFYFA